MGPKRIRAIVAESSSLVRNAAIRILESAGGIDVIDSAEDGHAALRAAIDQRPDLLLLSLDLPRMSGRDVLARLMASFPTAVIAMGEGIEPGGPAEAELTRAGAVYAISRPAPSRLRDELESFQSRLGLLATRAGRIKAVRILAPGSTAVSSSANLAPDAERETRRIDGAIRERLAGEARAPFPSRRVVVIGSSTGGPSALRGILAKLPAGFPAPILIAQHMPEGFTKDLARHLSGESPVPVREAREGDRIAPGVALLAPGRSHLRVKALDCVALDPPRAATEFCPSVNELFKTAAVRYRDGILAVVLTGMGDDGAAGVRTVKALGGRVIAQDEKTSAVYGMPREAAATGCVDLVAPIDSIARHIIGFVQAPQ